MLNILLCVLVFRLANAAPSDVKLEDIAEVTKTEVTQAEDKADAEPETLLEDTSEDTTASQSQRQKRWYNYYGLPPINPSFFNSDDSFNSGVFGLQDPLFHIHRRLQDISNTFRQQQLPQYAHPSIPQFPAFVPVIYIPQVGCGCTPDHTAQRPPDNRPVPPQDNNKQNETNPDITNRQPVLEDERQNWGVVSDDTNNQDISNNEEDDGDGSRPISFEPIRPIRPMNRPPPPVEHGSEQVDVNAGTTTTTTSRPTSPQGRPAQAPSQPPQAPGNSDLQPPSNCDSAILRCCLLPQVTYDCFALQGCPDPSSYGYPCDNGVISRVIDRFLRFYGQRNG